MSNIKNKKGYTFSLYRSPSQIQDEFDNFLLNFEQLIDDTVTKNHFFILNTSDANFRKINWWKNDLSTTEVAQVDSRTTSDGVGQIISDPTHLLSSSSPVLILYLETYITW